VFNQQFELSIAQFVRINENTSKQGVSNTARGLMMAGHVAGLTTSMIGLSLGENT